MILNQLEAFVAAVSLRTFTSTAEALKMSQPAVSDLIRRLEAELGAQLLHAVRAVQPLGGGTATFVVLRNAESIRARILRGITSLSASVRPTASEYGLGMLTWRRRRHHLGRV